MGSVSIPLSPAIVKHVCTAMESGTKYRLYGSTSEFIVLASNVVIPRVVRAGPIKRGRVLSILVGSGLRRSSSCGVGDRGVQSCGVRMVDRRFKIIHSCAAASGGIRVDVSKLLPNICFVELSSSGRVLAASILFIRWFTCAFGLLVRWGCCGCRGLGVCGHGNYYGGIIY